MATPIAVDDLLAKSEIAHQLHKARHTGSSFFCESDSLLADQIVSMFEDHDWTLVKIITKQEVSPA